MRNASFCGLYLSLFLLAMLNGCLSSPGSDKDFSNQFLMPDLAQDPSYTARINCFLSLKNDQGPIIRMEVTNIEIISDNFSQSLTNVPLKIDSSDINNGQLFLGGVALPPGLYHRLRLSITKAEVQERGGKYSVIAPEPFSVEVDLTTEMNLKPEDSSTLIIIWDVQNSIRTDNTFFPALTATIPLKQIPIDLVFASCPDIDTIFVVRVDKNWVVDSFGLKGGPTYLAMAPGTGKLLYVLASRDRMIKVVEVSTYRIINFFPVPLNDEPTFMTISPDGRSGYLLDERSGYLTRINLTTGRNEARILLNYRPKYAVYLQGQNLLAVSLSLSQKVLLLDPESLEVRGTISTGSTPNGLAVSDNHLLIAEYGENTVSITDLSGRGAQSRIAVGFGPRRLLEAGNQLYVSNYNDGSLSVLMSDQLELIQEIFGLGRPLDMVFNGSHHRLYVADEKMAGLAVIDTNSNRLIEHIVLGARPFGLEVIE